MKNNTMLPAMDVFEVQGFECPDQYFPQMSVF